MFHQIACRTALLSAMLLSAPVAALACDGADCPAPGKPLDIQKFMREQAASTRAGEPHRKAATRTAASPAPLQTAAAPKHHHHTLTARKAAPLTPEATASFAAQHAPDVQEVASDEFNAIDQAAANAPAPPPETVGAAPSADPSSSAPTVVADAFNEIDSKASDTALPGNGVRIGEMPKQDTSHVSWLQWIWGALGNTFGALAAALHQLTGL